MNGTKSINVFIAKMFGFYSFWLISDYYLSHEWGIYNRVWTYFYHIFLKIVHSGSVFVLENLMGEDVVSSYNALAIVGSYGVVIGNNCVGFGLTYAFSALIVSYPGPWKLKLWFIPAGAAIISLINIIRIVFLTRKSFDQGIFDRIEAHDLYNNIVYVIIFFMWVIWVRIIGKRRESFEKVLQAPDS